MPHHRCITECFEAPGRDPTQKKFTPTSISAKEVFTRLNELVPAYNKEMAGFCAEHADRRNSELHSGDLAFTSPAPSEWLPRFYLSCRLLLESMDRTLSDFVSDEHSAQAMIASFEDAAAKAVQQDINAHRQVWLNKDAEEQKNASLAAAAWATRQKGHRVPWPACDSPALLFGSPSGKVTTKIDADRVVQQQTMLPGHFHVVRVVWRLIPLSQGDLNMVSCQG